MTFRARTNDTLSREGAKHLVRTIKDYWWARGYTPHVYAERFVQNSVELWRVRSDMVNGHPATDTRIRRAV